MSFASPQMNWNVTDPITAFTRFKQKCQLTFSSVLKAADDEEKVSYLLLRLGEKGLDIQELDIKKRTKTGKSLPLFSNSLRINWG